MLLWRDYGAAGLAFATALGAIANALILATLAIRQKKAGPDQELVLQLSVALIGTIWLVATLLLVREFAGNAFAALPAFAKLAVLTTAGIAAYGAILLFCARLAKLSLRFR